MVDSVQDDSPARALLLTVVGGLVGLIGGLIGSLGSLIDNPSHLS